MLLWLSRSTGLSGDHFSRGRICDNVSFMEADMQLFLTIIDLDVAFPAVIAPFETVGNKAETEAEYKAES